VDAEPLAEAVAALRLGRCVAVATEASVHLVLPGKLADEPALDAMLARAGGGLALAMDEQRARRLGMPDGIRTRGGGLEAGRSEGTARLSRVLRAASGDEIRAGLLEPGCGVRALPTAAGGLLARLGAAEAAVALVRAAGFGDAAVVARAARWAGTPVVTLADVVAHCHRDAELVERVTSTTMPTRLGTFTAVGHRTLRGEGEVISMVKGDVAGDDVVVRVQRRCLAGEALHSGACPCGVRLDRSLQAIEAAGQGVVVCLNLGDVDIMWEHLFRTPSVSAQQQPAEVIGGWTAEEWRLSAIVAAVLRDLDVASARILLGDGERPLAVARCGVPVTGVVALGGPPRHDRVPSGAA
jgi:3,4-dihydroxy 2-butanone 4-phosphate synthase/GTP cyclohydrolase II